MFDEKRLNREGEGKRNNPFLYFKNLENPETAKDDFAENEKPRNEADKQRAESDSDVSRFLGLANSKNLENLENLRKRNFCKMFGL